MKMDSASSENKKQTRSQTSKKDIQESDSKISISNNGKSAFKRKRMNRKAGGIIYIGHIPHGFYEDEMKSYFNQFGKVLATTVARSKKTGRSKGYGFIEFKDEEVAKVAAETMNNYLMFNRILECRYIPPEEKRGRVFERNVSAFDFPKQRNRMINEQQKAKAFSNLTQETYLEKAQAKINEFRKFFEERGIEFNFQIKTKGNTTEERKSKIKAISNSASLPEFKVETENDFAVLEIDESEDEISFKTPPRVKKIIKKSLGSPAATTKYDTDSRKSETQKLSMNLSKKSNLHKTKKKGKAKRKTTGGATNIDKKLGQKTKLKEKSKAFLMKDILSPTKQKKEKRMVGKNARRIQKKTSEISNVTESPRTRIQISIKAES